MVIPIPISTDISTVMISPEIAEEGICLVTEISSLLLYPKDFKEEVSTKITRNIVLEDKSLGVFMMEPVKTVEKEKQG